MTSEPLVTSDTVAPLQVSYEDDPRVVKEAATEDYSTHAVPRSWRSGKLSLSMAWFALFSAMFWLVVPAQLAGAVGTVDTIIGLALSAATYGAINYVFTRYAIRTGLTVALMSRRMFGYLGAALAPLIFGATAIYYAVFEGSVVGAAFSSYFGGSIKIWYLVVVLYSVPLAIGGIRVWLDKLNGVLLPFYIVGLAAAVIAAAVKHDAGSAWLTFKPKLPYDAGVPGWLYVFMVFMGVWIMMMYTIDFARFGKPEDAKYHGIVTFGPLFYVATFLLNGLVGIFLAQTVPSKGALSELSSVNSIISLLGFAGVLLVWVSQTRINTANYYLSSANLEAFASRTFKIQLPRIAWAVIAGAIIYLIMLTDVLTYILQALAWQGVFVVAWVGIALTHIVVVGDDAHGVPEFRPGRVRLLTPGVVAWLAASALGIYLVEGGGTFGATWSAPITLLLAVVAYGALVKATRSPLLARGRDPRDEVDDVWTARIRCHECDKSYVAIEMDRDPSAGYAAICSSCAAASPHFYQAAHRDSVDREGKTTPRRR